MAPSRRLVEMDIYSSMYRWSGFVSFGERAILISDVAWIKILELMELYFASGFDSKITWPYMRLYDNLSLPSGMTLDRLMANSKEAEFLVAGIEGVGYKVEATEKLQLTDARRPVELILPSSATSITYLVFSYTWDERNGTSYAEGEIHALTAMPPLLP